MTQEYFLYSDLSYLLVVDEEGVLITMTHIQRVALSRRDLNVTTYNIHNRKIPMPPSGFEPAIPATARPHTYASDRVATVRLT